MRFLCHHSTTALCFSGLVKRGSCLVNCDGSLVSSGSGLVCSRSTSAARMTEPILRDHSACSWIDHIVCSQSYSSLVTNVHTICSGCNFVRPLYTHYAFWSWFTACLPLSLLHLALPLPVVCVLTGQKFQLVTSIIIVVRYLSIFQCKHQMFLSP